MSHFTYCELDKLNLCQGDILKRTPELENILQEIHPHYYSNNNNKLFMVVTQSCDLVKRNNQCNAKYITLAAVRSVELCFQHEIVKYQYDEIEKKIKVLDDKRKVKFEQFIERLLNNNEPDYFFIYREPSHGIEEDLCTFLKLTIPLKAVLHYDTLLNAKLVQLNESFQHKLGYLIGNSFILVGTEDWLPKHATVDEYNKLKDEIFCKLKNFTWATNQQLADMKKFFKNKLDSEISIEAYEQFLQIRIKEKENKFDEIKKLMQEELEKLKIDKEVIEKFINRVSNKPELRSFIK
jgi:hypothetical protein